MRKIALSLLVLGLFASFAMGGIVYLEGPNERGEGILPLATSNMDPLEFGTFTVDIYAEDMPGFAGFQLLADFVHSSLGSMDVGFYVSYGPGDDPPFEGRAAVYNHDFLSSMPQSACSGQTVGWLSMDREPPVPPLMEPGPFIDKSITDKTLLMSVTYWYTSDAPPGDYTIGADPGGTVFGDTREEPPTAIPYTVVGGGFTIVPEPATMALLGMGIIGLVGYGRKRIRK